MNPIKANISRAIAFSLLALAPSLLAQNLYSIADLEVLSKGKSYEEFFAHARDVIPTQRTKYWTEMVSNMAIDFVDEKRELRQYNEQVYKKINELGLWPELKRDEFYQIKRNSYALSYFSNCLAKKEKKKCRTQMNSFWKTANKDLETSFQMAQIHYGFFPGENTMAFLRPILTQNEDQFYCGKDLVKEIFIRHLQLDNIHLKEAKQREAYLNTLISKSCWNKMVVELKTSLTQGPTLQGRSLFLALDINQNLDPIEYHEWMVRYFLEGPDAGDLLNLSWNALKYLGENFNLREKVQSQLMKRDPLPGHLLETLDQTRSQAMAFYLQETFPEYLSGYVKTCLNFLEGRGSFPYGNPTPACHSFFRTTEKGTKKLKDLISSNWRTRYLKLIPILIGQN